MSWYDAWFLIAAILTLADRNQGTVSHSSRIAIAKSSGVSNA